MYFFSLLFNFQGPIFSLSPFWGDSFVIIANIKTNVNTFFEFFLSFFKKVEKKTKVDKNTIVSLAEKLQNGNMKDEKVLREVIETLSKMTGKNVSKEQEDKIVSTVVNDKVPKDIDKLI